MKQLALVRAAEHLELAKVAATKLTAEHPEKVYLEAWSQFLAQASRFFSKMEQGAKGCNSSQPWFGRKKSERRTDPLLCYVHHARDVDEHGLEYVVAKTGSGLTVHMAEGATEIHSSFEMMIDSSGKVHIRHPDTDTPDAITKFELSNPRIELVRVTDSRYNDSFDPPTTHMGKPIVFNSPSTVAALAISYLESMLEQAHNLPKHSK